MTAVDDIEVARATPDQWERVRDLRLAALEDAPDAFWATLEDERDRREPDWREWLRRERRLLLATLRDEPAIALYQRFGFAPTGRTSAFPPPREHITEHERARDLTDPAGRAERTGPGDHRDR